jgi:hypothetical protein
MESGAPYGATNEKPQPDGAGGEVSCDVQVTLFSVAPAATTFPASGKEP